MTDFVLSEEARRAAYALLPQGAFETTPDGAWDFVSPALLELFGDLPASSLLGREWLSRVHADDFQRVLAEYRQAREFHRPWRQTFRMLRYDGSVLHVGVDANPLPDEQVSRGVRYVGLVRDRTSIVRAEGQVADSLALMHTIQEGVREGILINRVDITVAANSAAARILGYDKPEDLIGLTAGERLNAADHDYLLESVRIERDSLGIVPLRKRDGSTAECAVHATSVIYEGAPARLVTFLPMGDELMTHVIAARSELQMHALETLLHVPYHRIALAGATAGRIQFANQAFCELVGRDAAELVGTNILEFTHPADRAVSAQFMAEFETTKGERGQVLRKRFLRPDGTEVPVELRSAIFRDPVTNLSVGLSVATRLDDPAC